MPEQGHLFAASHDAEFMPDILALAERNDIDAVTIATPSGAHAKSAVPFLKKGKAVLCEKPLEITLEKIDAILHAAQENNALLAGVLQLRLGGGARALKRAVTEGRFGNLALCSAYLKWWREQEYYDSVGWRGTWALDGGGALMNQGVHAVDLLQWLVGMPAKVFAFAGLRGHRDIEVEDTVSATLQYPNGAMGVIEASTACRPGFGMRIEISGDKGSAVLQDDKIIEWKFDEEAPEDEKIRTSESQGIVGGSGDPRAIGFEGHKILIEDLCNAIRCKQAPMIPGSEARNAVQLILAIYQSAREGRMVSL